MTIKREWILLLIIAVLAFWQLHQCNSSTGTEDDIDLTPDTTYIEGPTVYDTVLFHDTVIKYKYLTNTEISVIHDTITGDTIRTYNTPVIDSLIEGSFTTKVKGSLLSTDFQYKPLFPKYITSTRVDTLRIKEPIPVPKEKWGVYVGAEIGGNQEQFRLQPTLLIKTNKKLQFSAGYDIIQKTYNVGAYTKLGR